MLQLYAIYLLPPPGLLNSEIFSMKVSKSAQISSSQNSTILIISQWLKTILPNVLDPSIVKTVYPVGGNYHHIPCENGRFGRQLADPIEVG